MSQDERKDEDFNFRAIPRKARVALGDMYEAIEEDAFYRGRLNAFEGVMGLLRSFGQIDSDLMSELIVRIKSEIGVTFDSSGEIVDADDRGIRALSTLASTH